jgi:hypothetical protein
MFFFTPRMIADSRHNSSELARAGPESGRGTTAIRNHR